MRLTLLISLLVLICGCSNSPDTAHSREAKRGLDQATAMIRKQQVSNPSYSIDLQLNAEGTPFSGSNLISFDFQPQGSDLSIDFSAGNVIEVKINGKPADYQYNGFFLNFSEHQFKTGSNQLLIKYTHPYSKDGGGLYYFKDPLDQTVYTYSDLEPYDANRIFPLFDQPNLKARFTLNVDVPANWQVVSANRETSITQQAERALWQFPQTLPISSYVISVHAGEYASFDLGNYQGIDLRLFSRQSNAEYVPVDEWNQITRQGFAFFNDFFGVDYPFGKYDQLAVPDFNAGAMENVAAVTFADRYCCVAGVRSISEKSFLKNAILHEQAHMWFGNLVTMDWWDDIWLNESFAEIAGYFALETVSDFDRPWLEFLWQRKTWGYRDDEYVTSHPIKGAIDNTDLVMSAIDGITYAKGGSALRQLKYYIGDDNFRIGLQNYMRKYAYKNTQFQDLLDELALAAADDSSVNINQWADEWIKTIGVNRVAAKLQCDSGNISSLQLIQTGSPINPQLRSHKLQVGLYQLVDDPAAQTLAQPTILTTLMQGETTELVSAVGMPCPALILPNIGDYTFIKVILDAQTRETLAKHISQIDDPHARALFWLALWDGAMDAEYPLSDYTEVALRHAADESNNRMISGVANSLATAQSWLERMNDHGQLNQHLTDLSVGITALADQRLLKAEPGGDEFQLWFNLYRSAIYLPEQQQTAAAWLRENNVYGWVLDQRSRWALISILATYQYPGIDKLIAAEQAADPSARGQLRYLAVKTIIADRSEKLAIIEKVLDPESSESLARRRAMAGGLFSFRQPDVSAELAKKVIQRLIDENDRLAPGIRDSLASYTVGSGYSCSEQWDQLIDGFLTQSAELNSLLANGLRESQQNNHRCMAAKALLAD
jgi:aminopeptidase N